MSQRFWMVYGEGCRGPAYKHSTKESAEAECKRLARQHPGVTFFVLTAIRGFVKADVQTVEFDDPDIPW